MDDTLRINVEVNNRASGVLSSITKQTNQADTSSKGLADSLKSVVSSLGLLKVTGATTAFQALKPLRSQMASITAEIKKVQAQAKKSWQQGDIRGLNQGYRHVLALEAQRTQVLRKGLAMQAAQLAAVIALWVRLGIKVAKAGDEIKDNAQKVFMSTTAYQEWGYVLKQNGIDMSSLTTSMRYFAKNVKPGSDVYEAFTNEIERIQGLSSETERAQAAMQSFGSRANELMPILNSSSADVKKLMMEYRLLGGTMSNELIAKSDRLTDSINAMKVAWKGIGNTLGEVVMPIITKVVQGLTLLFAKINIVLRAIFGLKETFGGSESATSGIASNMSAAAGSAKEIKRTLLGFDELNVLNGQSSGGGGADYSDFSDGMLGGQLNVDDSMLKKLDSFKKRIDELKGLIRNLVPWIEIVAGFVLILTGHFVTGLAMVGLGAFTGVQNGAFVEQFNFIKTKALEAIDAVKKGWGIFVDWLKGIGATISNTFTNIWEGFKDGCIDVINGLIDKINNVITKVNEFIGVINKIPGINIPTLGTINTISNSKGTVNTSSTAVNAPVMPQPVTVNVDGKKLFDVVVGQNNRAIKSTGFTPLLP